MTRKGLFAPEQEPVDLPVRPSPSTKKHALSFRTVTVTILEVEVQEEVLG